MSAYIVFLLIIVIEWILLFPNAKLTFGKNISYKQKKIFLAIVCIEMICFVGLRTTNLGADTTTYLNALEYYSSLPHEEILKAKLVWPYDFEVGYFLLTKFCAWLSLSKTSFLFLIAILIYVPVCWFILQYSENPLLSVLTYFAFGCFEYSVGIFRQMIALSIVLIGTKYIRDRKIVKYLLTIGLAMTFHTTAIAMLPLYWMYQARLEKRIKWIFAAEVICFISARTLVLLAIRVFPKYLGYVSGRYDVQGGSYSMLVLLNLVFIAGCIIEKRDENQDNVILRTSINATVIALFLQILGYSMGIVGRIVPYYSIYLMILVPFLMNRYFKKNIIFVYFIGTMGLIILFYFLTKNSYINPYSFIFMNRY